MYCRVYQSPVCPPTRLSVYPHSSWFPGTEPGKRKAHCLAWGSSFATLAVEDAAKSLGLSPSFLICEVREVVVTSQVPSSSHNSVRWAASIAFLKALEKSFYYRQLFKMSDNEKFQKLSLE